MLGCRLAGMCRALFPPSLRRLRVLISRCDCSRCFYGDTESNSHQASDSNCLTACPGNEGEACGSVQDMLIYTDAQWQLQDAVELAHDLQQLEALVNEVQGDISLWNTYLNMYQALVSPDSSRRRRGDRAAPRPRQADPATQKRIAQFFQQVQDEYDAIMHGKNRIVSLVKDIQRLFQISLRYQKIRQDEEIELVERIGTFLLAMHPSIRRTLADMQLCSTTAHTSAGRRVIGRSDHC
jgi:hypothetical protein